MDDGRLNRIGDQFGNWIEETGGLLGLNFGLAVNALHDAVQELGDSASDAEILAQAKANWENLN